MTIQDLPVLLGAVGAFLVILGGAIRWLVNWVDGKLCAAAAASEAARLEMRKHLEQEITELRGRVVVLQAREGIYLKRVLQLEAFIQGQKGLVMPRLDGWPPQ